MKPFYAFVYFLLVCLSTLLKERNYGHDDISKSVLIIDLHCGMLENKSTGVKLTKFFSSTADFSILNQPERT